MKKLILALFTILLVIPCALAQKPSYNVGLVADGQLKENSTSAYDWAKTKFNTQIIGIPKSKTDLTKFGVVWWDESNGASIPASFLDDAVVKAFLGRWKPSSFKSCLTLCF